MFGRGNSRNLPDCTVESVFWRAQSRVSIDFDRAKVTLAYLGNRLPARVAALQPLAGPRLPILGPAYAAKVCTLLELNPVGQLRVTFSRYTDPPGNFAVGSKNSA